MRLLHRMGFQLRADAHGVLDEIEDRALVMKQHLREAEIELDRKRAHLEMQGDEAQRLAESRERIAREIARLDADVELALRGGEDDLARFCLRQLLPLRRTREALALRLELLARERASCGERLERQTHALEQLRERVRVRLEVLEADWPGAPEAAAGVADEEIEIELLRRRRETLAGEVAKEEAGSMASRPAGRDAGQEEEDAR